MGEEVVDKQGTALATLACYWQSVSGLLVFLGIKVKGTEASGSSPATANDRHARIQLGFEVEDIMDPLGHWRGECAQNCA